MYFSKMTTKTFLTLLFLISLPISDVWARNHQWNTSSYPIYGDILYTNADMQKGSLDIIQSAHAGMWVEAYRLMNGLQTERHDFKKRLHREYETDYENKKEWIKQASSISTTTPKEHGYRCAFKSSLTTLANHIRQLGRNHPYVKEWVDMQNIVFSNCSQEKGHIPPPALAQPNDSPAIIAMRIADRDYQIASAYFYSENFDQALIHYKQIAASPLHPYFATAHYMIARTLLRKEDYAGTDEAITSIIKNPDLQSVHQNARDFFGVLADRSGKEVYQVRQLEHIFAPLMMKAITPEDKLFFDQQLISLNWDLWYYLSIYQPDSLGVVALRPKNDMLDWLLTFTRFGIYTKNMNWVNEPIHADSRDESKQDISHALQKWHETGKLHWLIAVILRLPPDHSYTNETINIFYKLHHKLLAGTATNEEMWSYPTLAHHAIRLLVQNNRDDEAEELIYQALDRQKEFALRVAFHTARYWITIGKTDRAKKLIDTVLKQDGFLHKAQPFYLLKLIYAQTPEELIQIGMKADYDLHRSSDIDQPHFIEPVADVLNLLPIKTLIALSQSTLDFPHAAKAELALVAWTRAVLLQDYKTADSLVAYLETAIPELKQYLTQYSAASTPLEKHRTVLYILLKHPRLKPLINNDTYSFDHRDTKQNTLQLIDSWNHNDNDWWCQYNSKKLFNKATSSLYNKIIYNNTFTDDENSSPEQEESINAYHQTISLFKPLQLENKEESASLAAVGPATIYLPKEVISWANDTSIITRYLNRKSLVPEALHHAVKVTQHGCRYSEEGETGESLKPVRKVKGSYAHDVFKLLHKNYWFSTWKDKTPYWY